MQEVGGRVHPRKEGAKGGKITGIPGQRDDGCVKINGKGIVGEETKEAHGAGITEGACVMPYYGVDLVEEVNLVKPHDREMSRVGHSWRGTSRRMGNPFTAASLRSWLVPSNRK